MSRNKEWVERQSSTPEARREFEQERLIAWTFERISEAMEASGRSKADIARILETSRANITQLLSGGRNVTLRTIADLAWACEARLVVNFEPLRGAEFIDTPVCLVSRTRPRVAVAWEDADAPNAETDFDRFAA